jgi:hypothetical protein
MVNTLRGSPSTLLYSDVPKTVGREYSYGTIQNSYFL